MSTYNLILADPPWRYAFSRSKSRGIERKYNTMTLDDLCNLPVSRLCDPKQGTVLALWATGPKLNLAMDVIAAWGFRYVTFDVWDKDPERRMAPGMGYYTRLQHEPLLFAQAALCSHVGVRLRPYPPPATSLRPRSGMHESRRAHSQKPECVYRRLMEMWPDARRVELFARRRRDGWAAWGDEVESDADVAALLTA